MATQGVVTVLKDAKVAMKIVVGCDGYNAANIAQIIRAAGKVPTVREAYKTALQLTCGCRDCLTIITTDEIFFMGSEDVGPLYRETFDDPRFNPRWKNGTADHVHIVRL